MVSACHDSNTCKSDTNDSTTFNPSLSRQASYKRQSSDSNDQDDFEDTCSKQRCATTNRMIACPIAKFGCTSELPYENLLEHYSTQIHQETLIKVIDMYIRQMHSIPYNQHIESAVTKDEYSKISSAVDILTEGVSCLHDDNVQIQTNIIQIHNNILEQQKEVKQLQQSSYENSQILDATQMNCNMIQTEINTIKQTLSDVSNTMSNNGSYIWKITNIAEKVAKAISGEQTSIYSPAFYSSSTGYKMCMRLYLNGDGNAKGTHLSLFFVLMRGDYDAILLWPFKYKVTFCLYNLVDNQSHIIDAFRPDSKSNSFDRPKSNMNIASGLTKFFPLSKFQAENNSYVHDDCMFIRCLVDFDSLPKNCIPYKISLNPGIPITMQERMIQAEVQKSRTTESNLTTLSRKTDNSKVNE
ncbi:unnamed protein product [Adineta steineri]|uniref:MATH domain-containing protein n=1 Tax=Adineta steineri TaxID=433720 RepID=A0A813QYK9_9BILA|nr:unnamed protein product [Adineta steineri]CAF0906253.1 unnamed protein product [Adineta steineri]CAF1116063.1 unnamed protein product [Adineta steineri]